jgi:hypothetical protein
MKPPTQVEQVVMQVLQNIIAARKPTLVIASSELVGAPGDRPFGDDAPSRCPRQSGPTPAGAAG